MPKLIAFRNLEGKKIKILEHISAHYYDFGTLILEDNNGMQLKAIVQEFRGNPQEISREVLFRWLNGRGKQPVSWFTLTEVLRDIDLDSLAHGIEVELH